MTLIFFQNNFFDFRFFSTLLKLIFLIKMSQTEKISGIILAGGKSSRMGQDKGLLRFQGKRLIEYTIDLLRPLCSQLLISTNQTGYEQFGFELVADQYPDCGPVGGLHAALNASENDWNIVLSCDTPFLNQELLKLLLKNNDGYLAVIPKHRKGMEPLAALYHRNLAGFFEQQILRGNFKLQKIIHGQNVNVFDVSILLQKHPNLFHNLNLPDDLFS